MSRWKVAVGVSGLLAAACAPTRAQDDLPTPTPPPANESQDRRTAAVAPPTSVEELARRLEAMEEMNRQLVEQMARSNQEHDEQIRALLERVDVLSSREEERAPAEGPSGPVPPDAIRPGEAVPPDSIVTPVPDYTEDQFPTTTPAPGYPRSNLLDDKRLKLRASFGPGFDLSTLDEEFRLRVNLESQIEGRAWGPRDQLPPGSGISGIYLPRQRIFFEGNITRKIEYELSINRGLGAINILNAYINLHFDDRFQLRFGRFFTPLPYDQYAISNYWMPTPERSLFTTNVGLNRQFGLKAWGFLLDQRLDYAAGLFNGSRNSFENPTSAMDFVGYLNTRPFQLSDRLPALKFLNLGTSVAFGHQDQSPVPVAFRIGAGSPDANIPGAASVPFLVLDRGVIERGERLLGSVHAAYFRKGLSLIGEWQYGYGNYATPTSDSSTQVPYGGFYVSSGYFLTGENVERRSRLYPLRPLFPTKTGQRRGPGAWEVVGRYSELALGDEVFLGGFADPRAWSNSGATTELGVNWYWNEYVKLYMFWLHGQFGDPVLGSDGLYRDDADMFWLRFQLYF